jgi:hypothetical protein
MTWHAAQVARLFGALAGAGASAGRRAGTAGEQLPRRQVLCVSHNAAFQRLCSHVVRLTRGPEGTQLADPSVAAAGAAAGQAARKRAPK